MGKHKLFVIALLLVSLSGKCRAGRTRKATISCTPSQGTPKKEEKTEYLRHPVQTGFPYHVSIRSHLYEMHHCAGTLISPHWVLTSAWCMDKDERGAHVHDGFVLVHSYSLEVEKNDTKKDSENDEGPEDIRFEQVIIHEDYSNGSYGERPYDARFDVALIKLEHDSKHDPVNLDIEGLADFCQDVELWNVGFGRASIDGPWSVKTEAVKYKFLSFHECMDHFAQGGVNGYFKGGKKLREEYALCVSNVENQCNLGMGSPLVSRVDERDVLVGFVTGATEECAYRDDPFVFGNVAAHMEWILDQDDVLKDVSAVAAKRRLEQGEESTKKEAEGAELKAIEAEGAEAKAIEVDGAEAEARAATSTRVSTADYSYPVSISGLDSDLHNCGGALIDPYYVLTAAHCVVDDRDDLIKKFTITIGSNETPPRNGGDHETMNLNTTSVIRRKKDGDTKDDVALVRLPERSKFDPVKLPYKMRRCCTKNTSLIVLARGAQTEADSSSDLHAALMDFMGRQECINRTSFSEYPNASFCAGHEVTQGALCSGDQGSPIVLPSGAGYEVLIGIATSEIDDDCRSAIAQFYRVGFLMRWIKQELKKERTPYV